MASCMPTDLYFSCLQEEKLLLNRPPVLFGLSSFIQFSAPQNHQLNLACLELVTLTNIVFILINNKNMGDFSCNLASKQPQGQPISMKTGSIFMAASILRLVAIIQKYFS